MDSAVASELSIRMEGGLELLLAYGDRCAELHEVLQKVTLENLPLVRSRLDTLASEESQFHRLWADWERLSSLASADERRRLEAVATHRRKLLANLLWLAGTETGDLSTCWFAAKEKLRWVARVQSARLSFSTGLPLPSDLEPFAWKAWLILAAIVGLLGVVVFGPAGVVGVVAVGYLAILVYGGRFRQPEARPCTYCVEGTQVDGFDDLPEVRAALLSPLRASGHCARCGMSSRNFAAAMQAVPDAIPQRIYPRDRPRRPLLHRG